jgi:hypothetical protein
LSSKPKWLLFFLVHRLLHFWPNSPVSPFPVKHIFEIATLAPDGQHGSPASVAQRLSDGMRK